MFGERAPRDTQRALQQVRDEIAALRATIEALNARADAAGLRADDSEARADAQDVRISQMGIDRDIDREVLRQLQAEGLVAQERAHHFEEALRSSRVIGAAIGIVMRAERVDEAEAFAFLSKVSQDSNVRLRVVAEKVVQTGELV